MHLCFLSSFNKHFTTDLPSSLPKVISPQVMLPKFAVVLPEIHGHDSKKCQWVKSIVRVKCENQVVHFPVDWHQKDCNPNIKHGNEKKLVISVSVWFSLSLFYVKAFCFERTTTKVITPIGTLKMPPSCLQYQLRQESSQVMTAEQDCDIAVNSDTH